MLKEDLISGGGNPTESTWARVCDTCRCSPSRVYCTADAAYLCAACDARIHSSAPGHHRVWVCESCEQLPAAFVCKADSASLCADCDAKVHSANPLASRHQRFPICGHLYAASPTNLGRRMLGSVQTVDEGYDEEDEDEAASWLLLNPSNNNDNNITKETNSPHIKYTNGCSVGGEVVDEYLDLVEFDLGEGGENNKSKVDDDSYKRQHNHHEHHQYTVPNGVGQEINDHHMHHHLPHSFQMGLDFEHIKPYAYTNGLSMPHTMSVSSLEVGVVPESTTSEISTSHNTIRPQSNSNGTSIIDLFSTTSHIQQQPAQLSPMDREARVQRYRQKKKTRKFEKTIRYASRKAYAETRPRLKGRFVKRTADDDIVEPNNVSYDTGYGVVPSF